MMMKKLIITGLLLGMAHSASAYEPDRAQANQAHELAECASYYLFTAEAMQRIGDQELTDAQKHAADFAMSLSIELSNEKVMQARVKMAFDKQSKMIDNDFSNLSILLHEYADICKSAVEEPIARYQYWLAK